MAQKVNRRHTVAEENTHGGPSAWKEAREAVDAVGVDGMSGEETDGEVSTREKQLIRVPVRWINPELTRLFHAMDTWKAAVDDEGFKARGNRPFIRPSKSKEPATGTVRKGLPRNWYDDSWYRSQSDAKKVLLGAAAQRKIPALVSLICFPPIRNYLCSCTPATLPATSPTLRHFCSTNLPPCKFPRHE